MENFQNKNVINLYLYISKAVCYNGEKKLEIVGWTTPLSLKWPQNDEWEDAKKVLEIQQELREKIKELRRSLKAGQKIRFIHENKGYMEVECGEETSYTNECSMRGLKEKEIDFFESIFSFIP